MECSTSGYSSSSSSSCSSRSPSWGFELPSSSSSVTAGKLSRKRARITKKRTKLRRSSASQRSAHLKDFEGEVAASSSAGVPNERDSDFDESQYMEVLVLDASTEMLRIRFPTLSMRVRVGDFLCLAEGALLNDTLIDFYLNHLIAHLLPDDSLLRVHVFPSLFWYHLRLSSGDNWERRRLTENGNFKEIYDKKLERLSHVEHWIEEEDVFDADFLVMPINEMEHWSLAIVCRPYLSIVCAQPASDQRESASPSIIIFDSQQDVDSPSIAHFADTIRRFMQFAFNRREVTNEEDFSVSRFACVVPRNLPQQSNNVDCGLYILEYARRFFLEPPPKEYLFANEFDFGRLYPDFAVSHKRRDLQMILLSLCPDRCQWSSLLGMAEISIDDISSDLARRQVLIDQLV